MNDKTGYFDEKRIREMFSGIGLVVGDIVLDETEYIADIYIEINSAASYSSKEIKNIVEKIDSLEAMLVKQGFIHDIKFGDIYQGIWRIIIHFLNEEEIEKWEEDAMKQ